LTAISAVAAFFSLRTALRAEVWESVNPSKFEIPDNWLNLIPLKTIGSPLFSVKIQSSIVQKLCDPP